jgi:hypothetical protein
MREDTGKNTRRNPTRIASRECSARAAELLLPGALFVAIGAKLLAPLVFVDFRFAPFLYGTHRLMRYAVNIRLCSKGIQ